MFRHVYVYGGGPQPSIVTEKFIFQVKEREKEERGGGGGGGGKETVYFYFTFTRHHISHPSCFYKRDSSLRYPKKDISIPYRFQTPPQEQQNTRNNQSIHPSIHHPNSKRDPSKRAQRKKKKKKK